MADSSLNPLHGSDLSPVPQPGFEEVLSEAGQQVSLEAWLVEQVERILADHPGSDETDSPVIVGVAGSVAVGKSSLAARLADTISIHSPATRTVVVATDSFLLPNRELDRLGLSMRKGFPESFDYAAMLAAVSALRQGMAVRVPEYSHVDYDIVPGGFTTIEHPNLVIIEGVNVLQPSPESGSTLAELLDLRIYLDADPGDIGAWFVDRFLRLCAQEVDAHELGSHPSGFYAGFAGMEPAAVRSIAEWTWNEINEPNLRQYIQPSRSVADVIVEKGSEHQVRRVLRRS
ncbi:MAG: hypothetical protein WBA45_05965 [Microthrixaceae bacterium]